MILSLFLTFRPTHHPPHPSSTPSFFFFVSSSFLLRCFLLAKASIPYTIDTQPVVPTRNCPTASSGQRSSSRPGQTGSGQRHRPQTPNTGLRHPSSFGGSCRKAMLGVCIDPCRIIFVHHWETPADHLNVTDCLVWSSHSPRWPNDPTLPTLLVSWLVLWILKCLHWTALGQCKTEHKFKILLRQFKTQVTNQSQVCANHCYEV